MRPHRNPGIDAARIRANQDYLNHQVTLDPAQREDDAAFEAGADLRGWLNWRPDQPNDWWGGFLNLPRQWGGVNDDLSDDQIRDHDPRRLQGLAEVQLRHARDRFRNLDDPDNGGGMAYFKKFKPLNLEKLKPGDAVVRDVTLPPFKVEYDSYEQFNTKLNGTVILIKDNPYYISRTLVLEDGKFGLIVSPGGLGNFAIPYDDVKDCRPIAPGYVTRDGQVFWLYRAAERQNQQGMNHRNTFYRNIHSDAQHGARHDFLLAALANRKDCQYSQNFDQLIETGAISGLRLSNNVALYKAGKRGAAVGVEYCGRALGLMVNGRVKVLDETDLRPSWIHKDLAQVGLVMGE